MILKYSSIFLLLLIIAFTSTKLIVTAHSSPCTYQKENKDYRSCNFIGVDLSRADFSNANLSHANMENANLFGANFSNADLSNANLAKTNLFGAIFFNAILYNTNFSNANLKGAILNQAKIDNTTNFYSAVLEEITENNELEQNKIYTKKFGHCKLSIFSVELIRSWLITKLLIQISMNIDFENQFLKSMCKDNFYKDKNIIINEICGNTSEKFYIKISIDDCEEFILFTSENNSLFFTCFNKCDNNNDILSMAYCHCSDIKDNDTKRDCFSNLELIKDNYEAARSQCSLMSDKQARLGCIKSVKYLEKSLTIDQDFCIMYYGDSQDTRNACYAGVALINRDICIAESYCQLITDFATRVNCRTGILMAKDQFIDAKNLCFNITNTDKLYNCLSNVESLYYHRYKEFLYEIDLIKQEEELRNIETSIRTKNNEHEQLMKEINETEKMIRELVKESPELKNTTEYKNFLKYLEQEDLGSNLD